MNRKARNTYARLLPIVAIAMLMNLIVAQPLYADGDDSTPLNWSNMLWTIDNGNKVDKDLFYPPITAYIESSILYIQNDKPDGDLDIAIVSGKSGRVVWNQVYPKAATSLMAIPLDALPVGEYSLQVVNEWGGYLCGTFTK